jgi:hypothetical protein
VQVDAEAPRLALQLFREGPPQQAGQAGGAALSQHDLGDAPAPSAELFALFHPKALIAAEQAVRIQNLEHQQGCIEGGRQPVVRHTITRSRRAIRLARWK